MDHGRASKKHLHSNNNAANNKRVVFKSSFIYPDQVSDSRAPPEPKGTVHGPAKNSDSCDTTYSFSSDSSSDEFVQINPKILPKFKAPNIPKPYGPSKSTYKSEKLDVSSEALYRLKESINEPPQSTSQFSDITHESLFTHTSPILSPPVQVMERPGPTVFDPNRIPSSIFGKPSNPTEWSVASNDSLFSIHIGNSSFSRDHTARVAYKSGELLKSGELCQSPETQFSCELYKSGELGMAADVATPGEEMGFGQTSTSAKVVKFDKSLDIERSFCEDMHPRIVDERINDVPTNNRVDANVVEPKDSYYDNRYSDKSERNIQSIAVPRKKKKSSCRCCKSFFCCNWSIFSCNWTSCCFKWAFCSWPCCSTNCCKWPPCPSCKLPSCSSCCKWPSCSNCCKLPSCSNCCKWPSCSSCCKWPSCSNCCKWPSCSSCCKWPSCSCPSCCKWPSCSSCCKWPSCSSCSCKWPSCSSCSCKWPSCCSCEWPTCLSCKCQCLSCSSSCCLCCESEPQGSAYDYTSKNQGMTGSEKVCPEPQYATRSSPMKASSSSSSKRCSCFSCTSSCSCCSC